AACAACERFGRDLLALRALLRETGRVAAPPDFDARLARRLGAARAAAPRPTAWSWLLAPRHGLATAAAVIVLAVGTVAVSRMAMTPEAPATVADGMTPAPPAVGVQVPIPNVAPISIGSAVKPP